MNLLLQTLCFLSCQGSDCSLDCRRLCSSCEGCSSCCSPHPYNCMYFFHCDRGQINIKQCPPNTGFNPNTHICESNFPCYLNDCLNLCTTLDCKEDCCAPNDCTSYFQCRNGSRVLRFCSSGHFNPETLKCEKNYNCSISNIPNDRPILNKDEFLNLIYSIYRNVTDSITKPC